MDQSMLQGMKKAIEVAIVCAAQDGLDKEEMRIILESVENISIITTKMSKILDEEDIDLTEAFSAALDKIEEIYSSVEIMTLDENYMEKAKSELGESATLNNLCVALCALFSFGDGEISQTEHNAFGIVSANLPHDKEIVNVVLESLQEHRVNLGE